MTRLSTTAAPVLDHSVFYCILIPYSFCPRQLTSKEEGIKQLKNEEGHILLYNEDFLINSVI